MFKDYQPALFAALMLVYKNLCTCMCCDVYACKRLMRTLYLILCLVHEYQLSFSLNPVTGDTNFAMPFTRLTVGGFTQPGVARSLIELPSNAEKGLSHRLLWLFPSPLFGKFSSLKEVDKSFQHAMGKSYWFTHEMCSMYFCFCVYIHIAKLLVDQWKSCPSTCTSLPVRIFRIARDSTAFGEYYDHVHEGLRTLAGMD